MIKKRSTILMLKNVMIKKRSTILMLKNDVVQRCREYAPSKDAQIKYQNTKTHKTSNRGE